MHGYNIKNEVRKLRSKGLTFTEIKEYFPDLSKSSISNWVKDIKLTEEQEKRILEKQLKRREKFQIYNKAKQEKAILEAKKQIKIAAREIGKLSIRDLKIVGASLYWAEGHNKSRYSIEFTNSNPDIIVLMMRFFREVLVISEDKFRCKMTIHPGIREDKCLKFWSKLTAIPPNQFYKTWVKPPKSSNGKMHNILYNGTVGVTVHDVNKLRRLKGLISTLK